MARIRTIKPDFFTDDDVADLSAMERLLYIGLWTQADKAGRLEDRPKAIKARLFPYDDTDVAAMLVTLADRGFIRRYAVAGVGYIDIPTFSQHQVVNNREPDSKLPAFEVVDVVKQSISTTREARVVLSEARVPDAGKAEGKGRERKGRERKGREPAPLEVGVVELELELGDPKTKPVDEVLAHYAKAMQDNGVQVRETPKRRKLVQAQLQAFSAEQLKEAITGLTRSDWHMGRDPKTNGQSYTDLKYAIEGAERVEKFVELSRAPAPEKPRPLASIGRPEGRTCRLPGCSETGSAGAGLCAWHLESFRASPEFQSTNDVDQRMVILAQWVEGHSEGAAA